MKQWLNHDFESSSSTTPEFTKFAGDLKRYVKKLIPANCELVDWNKGHFEISGFIRNKDTNKYVYFNCSDVRYFRDSWYTELLVRTAKDNKDYNGGSNDFFRLDNLDKAIIKLTA